MAERAEDHSGPGECDPLTRPLRRDAERNRQRILEAASEVFTERGLDVSLDEVARHAGVGVGTVYRRFRSKEDLVEALFVDRIEEVAALAEQAAEQAGPCARTPRGITDVFRLPGTGPGAARPYKLHLQVHVQSVNEYKSCNR